MSVEVKVLEGASLVEMERRVKGALQEAGPGTMERLLREQEQRALARRWSCLGCEAQGFWDNRGRVERKIVTLAGAVTYRRVRLACQQCGKDLYPLDQAIGLGDRENVTLGVREQSLQLAVEMPYNRAAKAQGRLTGVEVSGRQMQQWAKAEGKRLKALQAGEREALYDQGVIPDRAGTPEERRSRVFVQVDGTFVNDRSGPGEVECKVGVIYSRKEKVAKNRWEIKDKRSYASTEGVDQFREQFVLECHRWGVFDAPEILFSGDGAPWIKRMCQEYFPGAIYLLDFWHLTEAIRRALGEEHEQACGNWIEEIRLSHDPDLLIRRIQSMQGRIRDPDRLKKLQELEVYVRNNADGIRNWTQAGFLGSSGAIEKAVDITICRRFKKRGMSWLKPGLSSLLALKLLKLNGEWDQYWQGRGLPLN
jgi:hypothetical protein